MMGDSIILFSSVMEVCCIEFFYRLCYHVSEIWSIRATEKIELNISETNIISL